MATKSTTQSPTPDDVNPKSRAWARLFVTSALLVEKVEAALKQAGFPSLAWYDVLWVLEDSEEGRLRLHDLAARVVVARYNLTRLADRLEAEGLITREPCEEDRRGAWCVITPTGRALRKRMWPAYEAQVNESFSNLITREEATVMAGALEKVRRRLRGEE
ncbi:MAG: MarR family winged helix-turn-helix transcriptional regulator [Burkholderiales bacterium]